jgi:hypothetical protein
MRGRRRIILFVLGDDSAGLISITVGCSHADEGMGPHLAGRPEFTIQ